MAVVYRALDTVLQREIALKVLYPQYSDDADLLDRFKREAVMVAALDHPSIVPVYDVGEHDGMAYIAMKLLTGRTLQDRLQEAGTLSLDELVAVLVPVAAALDFAHGRGIIHRDIKPGNIFLSQELEESRPLLTDFGIAKQLDTPGLTTTTGVLMGTPDYMAPEQIAGRPVDARTDGYALGMLAFRCLTGHRAFEGSTQDILLGHLHGEAPLASTLNPALSPSIDDVLARAIAANPADRFPSTGAFVRALRRIAQRTSAPTVVDDAPPQPLRRTVTVVAAQHSGTFPTFRRGTAQAPAPSVATARVDVAPPRTAPPPTGDAPPSPPVGVAPPLLPVGDTPRRYGVLAQQALPSARLSPWLLLVALAVIGGLAVTLVFAVGRQGAGSVTPVQPPPADTVTPSASATAELASPTLAPAAVGLVTSVASATPAPVSPTAAPPTKAPRVTAIVTPTLTATVTPTLTATVTPTLTATVTPTLTLTATVTVTATLVAGCPDLLAGGFAQIYAENVNVRTGLGCPLGREFTGRGSQQFFAHGMLFWWSDKNTDPRSDHIFVFSGLQRGTYEEFTPEDVAILGPEPTPSADPNVPRRGFGRVYFYRADISAALGVWTSPELELKGGTESGVIQFFAQGIMLWTPITNPAGHKTIYVFYNDQTFERFNDPSAG